MDDHATIYDAIGGGPVIRDLVEKFYPKVLADPLLAPIFPEDIRPVMEKQYMFLSQFFGGPPLYSEVYGHPMMRARHLPFPITPARAEAWLACMARALSETDIPEHLQQLMLQRLSGPAHHFINTEDESELRGGCPLDPLYQIKVKCACCEAEFSTSRVRPSFKKASKTDTDFCAYFKEVNPDFYVVRVCPYCGFASTESFATSLNIRQKNAYMEKMGKYWKLKDYGNKRTEEEALECYKLSLLTAQTVEESYRVIAGFFITSPGYIGIVKTRNRSTVFWLTRWMHT